MNRTLLALLAPVCLAWSQTPAPAKPVFEAASIKLDRQADGSDSESTPGRLHAQMTLKRFIAYAYDVKDFQITGGPGWVASDHYEIVAKLERIAAQPSQDAQLRQALQTLLAERFQLKFHRESKEVTGYGLTVDKSGFKLTAVPDTGNHGTNSNGGLKRELTATQIGMDRLAAFLSRETGSPVQDQTSLSGVYTFTLDWARDDPNNPSPDLPSLFTALQEKLGLRLESRKLQMDMLVIDSAARPSED